MGFYITTPVFYVNDIPHIGHAYTLVVSDVFARWQRQSGKDTFFLSGTDEHGLKVLRAAEEKNMTPQGWADLMVKTAWKPLLDLMHISNDDFVRTTESRHREHVKWFINRLRENQYIYSGQYSGYYCVSCEEFKTVSQSALPNDESVNGTLGKDPRTCSLPQGEEQNYFCEVHGCQLEHFTEKNYFFRLSAFTDRLLDLYKKNPDFIEPKSAYNEVVQFVKNGVSDLSISRSSFTWGIEVPWDEGHVVYVWFDALINYLTPVMSAKEGLPIDGTTPGGAEFCTHSNLNTLESSIPGPGGSAESDRLSHTLSTSADNAALTSPFKKYWPASHIIGKDILRFHAVIWPAMLMAAGLPVPEKIFAHGWLLVDGQKMSKSKLTGIKPQDLTDIFGVDAVRYSFLRQPVFGQDYSFSIESIAACYNSELADGYGNLACRLSSMYTTYLNGRVIVPKIYSEEDESLLQACKDVSDRACKAIDELIPHIAMAEIWSLAVRANTYTTRQQPWSLHKKQDDERLACVLYTALRALSTITILLSPIMPRITNKLWSAFGADGGVSQQNIRSAWGGKLSDKVSLIPPMFPKITIS